MNKIISVTKTFLPPKEEYNSILEKAWNRGWITNRGELVSTLEKKLQTHLGVKRILLTNNGTIPLQIAIKALGLKDEIITTPFSYVASTSSIVWEGCKPIFVDIDPHHLTIDENKIENAISSKTTGILATHVFGNPCHVDKIEHIAKKHQLKVIFDAAHCFGVSYMGQSVLNYGDVSTCSFHATKIFHTGEGGALFCTDRELFNKLFYSHNFGHDGPLNFHGLGINGKMSELQAALGLSVLPYITQIVEKRKKVIKTYEEYLKGSPLKFMKLRENTAWNYSYFPVIFRSEKELLKIEKALNNQNIFPRRYFYPSLNLLPYVDKAIVPNSESISKSVLCLPLYVGLSEHEVSFICETIKKTLR